ncbi:MAG: hypothetical protein EBT71_01410 [Alphaproteobacteria bacterium]|nr:hypothetical protein [Alphaproteobacteria bacterium]
MGDVMSARYSILVAGFALWLVLFGGAAHLLQGLGFDNDTWLEADNPYQQARDMLVDQFNQSEATMFVFDASTLFTEQGYAQATAFSDAVARIDGVDDVVSPYDASLIMSSDTGTLLITTYREALDTGQLEDLAEVERRFLDSDYMGKLLSRDRKLAMFVVNQKTGGQPEKRVAVIEQIFEVQKDIPLLQGARLAGDAYLKYTLDVKTRTQLVPVLGLAGLGILLFLSALFGKLWKTVLVLACAVTAVAVALAVMVALGHNLTVIALALPVMLSVIVVSDSLHILRYWDNAIDMAEDEATISMILRDTFKATWLPCLTTSLTSAVGFGAFMTSDLVPLSEFGLDSLIGILLGYGIMMSALFLGLLWRTPIALARRGGQYRDVEAPRMADRVADGILHFDWAVVTRNRPLTFALAFTLAIVSVLALAFNAKSESNSLDVFFKPDSEMYRAFTLVDDELGGSGVVSMIFASDMQDYYRQIDPFNEVRALETQLAELAQVNNVDSYTKPVGQIHRALVDDGTQYPQTDEQLAQEILFSEWSRSDPQALPKVIYTGHSVFFGQLSGYILETQLVTIMLTFFFIFVILMLEFDFRLALAGMLACSLPILITMGSIAALGLPFDFATVIIASVTMGLSIDDTIHILHRYRFHLVDEHRSQFQSLRQALFIPGRPIVQSTFLFCFGAGVFLISDLVMLQRFAIFTMLGLVLALLGAVLLLPSLLSVPFFTKTAQATAKATE